jgi:hypothetical protein
MKICVFTICSKNYLAQAYVLGDSIKKNYPAADFRIYLVDGIDNSIAKRSHLIFDAKSLRRIKNYEEMAFKYNVIEMSTAIKPFAFSEIFETGVYEKVIYLDPDMVVYGPLSEVENLLQSKTILLTPHFIHPEIEYTGGVPLSTILWVGGYNCGFVAISSQGQYRRILDWWMARLENEGYADRHDGLHVDQKWMDLIHCLFPTEEIYILKHIGYNVAAWNMHERQLVATANQYTLVDRRAEGQFPVELKIFHFSGFDPHNPHKLHSRIPKYSISNYPEYTRLLKDYAQNLLEMDFDYYQSLGYSYDHFSDGTRILTYYRRLFRACHDRRDQKFSSYFNSDDPNGFYRLLKSSNILLKIKKEKINRHLLQTPSTQKKLFILEFFYRLLLKVLGPRRFYLMIKTMEVYGRPENQAHLLRGYKKINKNFIN